MSKEKGTLRMIYRDVIDDIIDLTDGDVDKLDEILNKK